MRTREYGLHDIYPLWNIPLWQTLRFKIFISFIIFFLIVLLGMLFFILIKKIKKQKKVLVPWMQALHNLSLLEEKISLQNQSAAIYIELMAIIKRYLIYRFSTELNAMTDKQLLTYFEQEGSYELQENLSALYKPASIVKYGHESIDEAQLYTLLQRARAIIHQTIPQKKS